MALPIFLRPLLLIGHYYRRLTGNFTGWLEQSNDQLFGPLEQMIVAVVITGLAMNPALLPQLRPQLPVGIPIQAVPIFHQQAPAVDAAPPSVPSQAEVNITTSTSNDTSPQSVSADAIHPLLNLLPSWRPNPIAVSLIILLISVLIHLIPSHLFQRVKHSWDIFWPPWQDRSNPAPASRSSAGSSSRSAPGDVPKPRKAQASAQGPDGSKAEARAGPSNSDSMTDEERAKRRAILAYQAKKAAAAQGLDGSKPSTRAASSSQATMTDEEKAKQRAILAYQAKKAAAASGLKDGDPKTRSASDAKSTTDPTKAVKTVVIDTENPRDGSKTQSEKARQAKDPLATTSGDKDDKKGDTSSGDEDDPLMAGDVRPLRSILKKSKKKPRQSKNVHHNHFMTMRGNRAHLVPFPHGLHPPPDQPRNTLWWRNIPKNADHMMAPPPVPKVVTDVLAGEDPAEIAKKAVPVVAVDKAGPSKEGDKLKEAEKEKLKEKEREREKAKMKAELEARERAKARAGTATASVSIEPPKQPDIPIDPQVQKAMWASQAMLCLLLFYIQEQLGLVLLAFFVWRQLNATAGRQAGETTVSQQPIATATARAAAPPPRDAPVAVKVREVDDIPPEMKEKMARAKAEKDARAAAEEKKKATSDSRSTAKLDKGKGKEVVPDPVTASSKSAGKDGEPTKPRLLTKEERAAYRARAAKEVSTKPTSSKSPSSRSGKNDEPMTKEKWAKLSKDEKKDYMAEREKRKTASAKDEAMTKEKWGKMSDEDKKQFMADREKRKKVKSPTDSSTPASSRTGELPKKKSWDDMSDDDKKRYLADREKRRAPLSREEEARAKAEKWDKMSDGDKKRYMDERQKREQTKRAALKAGEGSGLSAKEKEDL